MPQNHINGSSTGIEPAASSAASSSNWSDNLSEYSSRFAQSYNGMAVAAAASRADPASYFGSAGTVCLIFECTPTYFILIGQKEVAKYYCENDFLIPMSFNLTYNIFFERNLK